MEWDMAITTCEYAKVWREGRDNRCGQTVGLRTWHDEAGLEHAACSHHWTVVEYRYPMADMDLVCVETHVPGCPGRAGGDHILPSWTAA